MPTHHVERRLPYAPRQLFDLVGDIGSYPEFVPWITSMQVGLARECGPGADLREAEAGVGFAVLTERFTTCVRRDAAELTIEVRLIRGPFRRLLNRWRFEPEIEAPQGATRVVFDIDFAFKSRMLDLLLVANFDRAVERLIRCFEMRALALYGPTARVSAPERGAQVSA